MGVSLCRLCVPNASFGMAGFDVDTTHLFPQHVLAAFILGGVTIDGGARVCYVFKAGLHLCSVALTALSWVGSAPKLLEWKP